MVDQRKHTMAYGGWKHKCQSYGSETWKYAISTWSEFHRSTKNDLVKLGDGKLCHPPVAGFFFFRLGSSLQVNLYGWTTRNWNQTTTCNLSENTENLVCKPLKQKPHIFFLDTSGFLSSTSPAALFSSGSVTSRFCLCGETLTYLVFLSCGDERVTCREDRWVVSHTRYLPGEQRSKPLLTYDIPLNPDWFIGILILAYYHPHILGYWVVFHPFYQTTNLWVFLMNFAQCLTSDRHYKGFIIGVYRLYFWNITTIQGNFSRILPLEIVRINGLFHLLLNGVYWRYNPTDPNLLYLWVF